MEHNHSKAKPLKTTYLSNARNQAQSFKDSKPLKTTYLSDVRNGA